MSDLSEKLTAPIESAGRARATLTQLKSRMGFTILAEERNTRAPTWVRVGIMEPESWKRVSGRGMEAVFELEGE